MPFVAVRMKFMARVRIRDTHRVVARVPARKPFKRIVIKNLENLSNL